MTRKKVMWKRILIIFIAHAVGLVFGYLLCNRLQNSNRNVKNFLYQANITEEIEKNNITRAIYYNIRAIENNTSNYLLYGMLGELYYRETQWAMAKEMFELAISLKIDSERLLNYYNDMILKCDQNNHPTGHFGKDIEPSQIASE